MVPAPAPERSHVELITIYEICRILGASLDLQRSFREALNVLLVHLHLDRAMIVLVDAPETGEPPDPPTLRVHSAAGLNSEQIGRGVWAPGEGIVGRVFQSGVPATVTNVTESQEFVDRTGAFSAQDGRRMCFLAVPLVSDNNVVGVLATQREVAGKARLSDDQRVLRMVATLLAQACVLARAVTAEHRRLQLETTRLQKALAPEPRGRYTLDSVVGVSSEMQGVFAEVHQAAPTRSTVLLRGESGTGKEAIARAIHFQSTRRDGPFIKVNCAALTESLLESELFGHERGAFTGAAADRKGRFEQAHGGSLFLDEVGDISAAFQAKLLRVLQEREFERVGGNRTIKVDVRLICATNRDLESMVQRGEYRADLYYRINVVSIFLPPLRERRSDIPPLVAHFLDRYNKENRRKLKVSADAMDVLTHCYWPGNVRELENCIERTATMAGGEVIRAVAFPCRQNRCLTQTLHHLDKEDAVAPVQVVRIPIKESPRPAAPTPPVEVDPAEDLFTDIDESPHELDGVVRIGPTERLNGVPRQFGPQPPSGERERLIWAMEQCAWVQAKAARLLHVTPRQLGYALRKHNIEVHKF
ncbi:nif-specific transcriptional activator NifA [Roseateles saccharophilus]|uniref:Nif-specific regulatory protein n=1 Tax=Roseateles saccharophilus TaxID=304 RepID=A0A4V2VSR9_ROSSA|nr:nif-specific transcriptional activator NifA [Roseateles saccharophilus]MDG0832022.1 nif-specific transcriptional activator NifA [Roseateles saccharophilus]TCV03430.1 Nif-specific regulatory protein [Roseateles saccharophilus]